MRLLLLVITICFVGCGPSVKTVRVEPELDTEKQPPHHALVKLGSDSAYKQFVEELDSLVSKYNNRGLQTRPAKAGAGAVVTVNMVPPGKPEETAKKPTALFDAFVVNGQVLAIDALAEKKGIRLFLAMRDSVMELAVKGDKRKLLGVFRFQGEKRLPVRDPVAKIRATESELLVFTSAHPRACAFDLRSRNCVRELDDLSPVFGVQELGEIRHQQFYNFFTCGDREQLLFYDLCRVQNLIAVADIGDRFKLVDFQGETQYQSAELTGSQIAGFQDLIAVSGALTDGTDKIVLWRCGKSMAKVQELAGLQAPVSCMKLVEHKHTLQLVYGMVRQGKTKIVCTCLNSAGKK